MAVCANGGISVLPFGGLALDLPSVTSCSSTAHSAGGREAQPNLDPEGSFRFDEFNYPPTVPTDRFYNWELTTIEVPTNAPHILGNHLWEFFHAQIAGYISKVNKVKYSLKACVLVGSAPCTIKLRMYRREQGLYVVEFQRRRGDAFTLSLVFREAVKFLKLHFDVAMSLPEKPLVAAPFDLGKEASRRAAIAALDPLFEIVNDTSAEEHRVEFAAALAELAHDIGAAAYLSQADALQAMVKDFLRSQRVELSLSAIQMLASIVNVLDAGARLFDGELMELVRGKTKTGAAGFSSPVQKQLTHLLEVVESDACGRAVVQPGAFHDGTVLAN